MKLAIEPGKLTEDFLAQLEPKEAQHAADVSARSDTVSMTLTDGKGGVVAYAVLGFDDDDIVTIYAARSANFAARATMQGIFGAAQVLGKPLRVHAGRKKLRAMATMFGAREVAESLDGDGLPMGVFYGV